MMTKPSARFVSRLTRETLAVVLAGGRGSRLKQLTEFRAKPAVPFGGKYRIVDFTLSNCLNSNIRRICVLTQYKAHYLIKHLQQGWGHFNAEHGEFVDVVPAQQWVDEDHWYQGTADAVFQSLDIINSHTPELVLVLAGDHVYHMDYGEMLAAHEESGADFTVACIRVPRDDARQFGVMAVDENYRIRRFAEKPSNPEPMPDDPDTALASMGIYVFRFDYLAQQLRRDHGDPSSSNDFGNDLIPYAIREGHHVNAYPFVSPTRGSPDYWRDVGTVDAYYQANMELLQDEPPLALGDDDWPLLTYQTQVPSAQLVGGKGSVVIEDVMLSGGCRVEASHLHRTILFSNVHVRKKSEVAGSLLLPGCVIGKRSRIRNAIIDNGCRIPNDTVIGEDADADRERFHVTDNGVVVVTRTMLGEGPSFSLPPR